MEQAFYFRGVHNFDITARQLDRFGATLNKRVREAKLFLNRFRVVVAGDFNLLSPNGQSLQLDSPNRVINSGRIAPLVPSLRPLQGKWKAILASLHEIEIGENSHINIASLLTNALNRMLAASHPQFCPICHTQVLPRRIQWRSTRLASVTTRLFIVLAPQENRPLRCLRGSGLLRASTLTSSKCATHFLVQLRLTTACRRHSTFPSWYSGRLPPGREPVAFANDATNEASVLTQLSAVARAVWTGNLRRANRISSTSFVGQADLEVVIGIPKLIDPVMFECDFAGAKSCHLNSQRDKLFANGCSSFNAKQRMSQKVKIIDRKADLSRRSAPYVAIGGLLLIECVALVLGLAPGVHSAPERIRDTIRLSWQPVFDKKNIHTIFASDVMKHYCKALKWDWSLTKPPDKLSVARHLEDPMHSAPGFEGVCKAATSS